MYPYYCGNWRHRSLPIVLIKIYLLVLHQVFVTFGFYEVSQVEVPKTTRWCYLSVQHSVHVWAQNKAKIPS